MIPSNHCQWPDLCRESACMGGCVAHKWAGIGQVQEFTKGCANVFCNIIGFEIICLMYKLSSTCIKWAPQWRT
jgi:hypothetical protein